jgi:hypothetical protein
MTTINLTLVNALRQQLAGQLATRRWLEDQRGHYGIAEKIKTLDDAVATTYRDLHDAKRGLLVTR